SPGDALAETVIELDRADWQGLVHELEAPAGLLYAGRVRCPRGDAMRFMASEPALRAIYQARPFYDTADAAQLRARRGGVLDREATFPLASDREDMAQFLRGAGYVFVRGVFSRDEIETFLAESEELRAEARQGDKLSWWGKDERGRELLCRVTR